MSLNIIEICKVGIKTLPVQVIRFLWLAQVDIHIQPNGIFHGNNSSTIIVNAIFVLA